MSKHRKHATRSDRDAAVQLKAGFARHEGKLRFITLTNCKDMKQWTELKRWIGPRIIEYFGVRTAEGNGVIHCCYTGVGIRRAELSKQWSKITNGAWNVHISKIVDHQKVLREMCFQHDKQRYFHSQGWSKERTSKQETFDGNQVKEYYNEKKMKFID